MGARQLSIGDFVAHCSDELSSIEKSATTVELVRDGKVVAYVCPAAQPISSTGTLSDWMGTGAGFTLAAGASLEDPAFTAEDWEDTSSDC